jgi:hypothetical protein
MTGDNTFLENLHVGIIYTTARQSRKVNNIFYLTFCTCYMYNLHEVTCKLFCRKIFIRKTKLTFIQLKNLLANFLKQTDTCSTRAK